MQPSIKSISFDVSEIAMFATSVRENESNSTLLRTIKRFSAIGTTNPANLTRKQIQEVTSAVGAFCIELADGSASWTNECEIDYAIETRIIERDYGIDHAVEFAASTTSYDGDGRYTDQPSVRRSGERVGSRNYHNFARHYAETFVQSIAREVCAVLTGAKSTGAPSSAGMYAEKSVSHVPPVRAPYAPSISPGQERPSAVM